MLLRAPVGYLRSGALTKRHGLLVVAMRHYPRYTPKTLIDEYVRALAPEAALFAEFKALERALGDHDAAFERVRYEERFSLEPDGLRELERLCGKARTRDVYLLCQCGFDQRCHADLLLLTARRRFDAQTSQIPFAYPVYEARLERAIIP